MRWERVKGGKLCRRGENLRLSLLGGGIGESRVRVQTFRTARWQYNARNVSQVSDSIQHVSSVVISPSHPARPGEGRSSSSASPSHGRFGTTFARRHNRTETSSGCRERRSFRPPGVAQEHKNDPLRRLYLIFRPACVRNVTATLLSSQLHPEKERNATSGIQKCPVPRADSIKPDCER